MSTTPGGHPDHPPVHPRGCSVMTITIVIAALVFAGAIVIIFENLSFSPAPSEPAPPDNATVAAQSVVDELRRSPTPHSGGEAAIRKAATEHGMSVREVRSMADPVKAILAKADGTMTRCFEIVVYSMPNQVLTGFTPLNACPTPTTT